MVMYKNIKRRLWTNYVSKAVFLHETTVLLLFPFFAIKAGAELTGIQLLLHYYK